MLSLVTSTVHNIRCVQRGRVDYNSMGMPASNLLSRFPLTLYVEWWSFLCLVNGLYTYHGAVDYNACFPLRLLDLRLSESSAHLPHLWW